MREKHLWSLSNEPFFAQTFDRHIRADLIKFILQSSACIPAGSSSDSVQYIYASIPDPGEG